MRISLAISAVLVAINAQSNVVDITYSRDNKILKFYVDGDGYAKSDVEGLTVEARNFNHIVATTADLNNFGSDELSVEKIEYICSTEDNTKCPNLDNNQLTNVFVGGIKTQFEAEFNKQIYEKTVYEFSLTIKNPFIDMRSPFDIILDWNYESERVDCLTYWKGHDVENAKESELESECLARGCNWNPTSAYPWGKEGDNSYLADMVPKCYFDTTESPDFRYYHASNDLPSNLEYLQENSKGVVFYLEHSDDEDDITISPYGKIWTKAIMECNIYQPSTFQCNFWKIDDNGDLVERFEIPKSLLDLNLGPEIDQSNDKEMADLPFEVIYTSDDDDEILLLELRRKSTGALISKILPSTLILSDDFQQISFQHSSEYTYGIGENGKQKFKREYDRRFWPVQANDHATNVDNEWGQDTSNFYGHQLMLMNFDVEDDPRREIRSNYLYIHNAAAAEVIFSPGAVTTYQTTGGQLNFIQGTGDEHPGFPGEGQPEVLIRDYHNLVGAPLLPAYWSLGFHLCRWGYQSTDELRAISDAMKKVNFPFDVQWVDIDYMDAWKAFTLNETDYWNDLPDFVDELHADNKKFVQIVDPGIKMDTPDFKNGEENPTFQRGLDFSSDIYIRDSEGNYDISYVWPGQVYFPDFTNKNNWAWWANEFKIWRENVNFDGIWIDMNEPANFYTKTKRSSFWPEEWYPDFEVTTCEDDISNPVFVPHTNNKNLWGVSICLNNELKYVDENNKVQTSLARDSKDLYAHSMAQATRSYYDNHTNKERGFILTRSNFAGTGKFVQHWLGDNYANWSQLRQSIVSSYEYSMFGFTQVGPDICGFFDQPDPELCMRWQQVGAFYTFSRNHNELSAPAQEPTQFEDQYVQVMKTAMRTRYELLPNLYTTMFFTSANSRMGGSDLINRLIERGERHPGSSPFRSLTFEFFYELEALNGNSHEYQFFWGDYLMFTPIVHQGDKEVTAFMPASAYWYDYYTFKQIPSGSKYTANGEEKVPIYIRGGKTIVKQSLKEDETTTVEQRVNDITLVVSFDGENTSTGYLYYDDGQTVDSAFVLTRFGSYMNEEDQVYEFKMEVEEKIKMGDLEFLPEITEIVFVSPGQIDVVKLDAGLVLGSEVEMEFPIEEVIATTESAGHMTKSVFSLILISLVALFNF